MIIFTHYPEYIEVVVGKKSDRTCKHWFCSDFSMSDDTMVLYDENKEPIVTFNQSEYHFKPIRYYQSRIETVTMPVVPYNATSMPTENVIHHRYISVRDMNGVR